MIRELDGKTYAAFTGAVIIGGANFIAVSYSNQELPPFFGAALRFALASALSIVIVQLRRLPLPSRRSSAGAALFGLLGFGTSYALLYYALLGLAAGTVSVIMAAVPLFTLVIAVILGQERFTIRKMVGGLLAVGGILVLSLDTLGEDVRGWYLLAAILAAISSASSSVVAKGLPEVHPTNMNAIGMGAGAILLTVGSIVFGEAWALPKETQTWMAVSWLVVFGSVGLFQLFLYVIKRLTASATVYAITCMPLIAVVLGALLLDQPVTVEVVSGGALVLAAVYVGAVSPRSARKTVTSVVAEGSPEEA